MLKQSSDKKYQILAELDEENKEDLVRTMEELDKYAVTPPTARSTDELIALLKPVLQEQSSTAQETAKAVCPTERYKLPLVLQLVRPQAMLLSKWFVIASVLVLLAGLGITNAFNGNTVKFLANASPVLGILTIFYEFRAQISGVSEMEAACPYSPAQLATARLIVVLSYDVLLCLAATPLVSYWQGGILWQVIVSWLAPLLLMLGIALATSLRVGIAGGCVVAATAWGMQFVLNEGGSVLSFLLPRQPAFFADFIGLVLGMLLILYSYKHWIGDLCLSGDEQSD